MGNKVPPKFEETLENIEELIKENEKNFETNLKRAKELSDVKNVKFAGNPLKRIAKKFIWKIFRPIVGVVMGQQEELNIVLLNLQQDLSRLQTHMMDKAYIKAQIDLLTNQGLGGVSGMIDGRMLMSMREIMQHPLYDINRDKPCVIQIVPSLHYGDAVGNDVLAIRKALKEENYITAVYAQDVHEKIKERDIFKLDYLPALREDDVVIYHFAAADAYVEKVAKLPCKVVLRYHNITPPEFFREYDAEAEKISSNGISQVGKLAESVCYGMVDSEYNKKDLVNRGYKCPIDVLPILIPFKDYEQEPDENVINQYDDGRTNIIFVGRGAPNKKIEDVILCFAEYKREYDTEARLFLVGNYDVSGEYYRYVQNVIEENNVRDIIFPGHISFREILAYYKVADVFLCMSEHEGFCVPLVEAMFFDVPIVAYASTAVPDTLGGAGIVVQSKNCKEVAKKINKVVFDKVYREQIIKGEQQRLMVYQYDVIKLQMLNFLKRLFEKGVENEM